MIQRYDFNLTDEPDKDGFWPFMSACIPSGDEGEALRPAVVLCPGGGYECVCEYREGELHIYPKGGHGIQLTTQRILRSRSMFPLASDVGGSAGRNIRPVNDSKELYV